MKIRTIWLLSLITLSTTSLAKQLSFSMGAYNIEAKGSKQAVSVSNIGSYRFSYSQSIWKNFSLAAGYNLILEDIVGGDKSYGISLGGLYYFGPQAPLIKSKIDNLSITMTSSLLPYIGLEFHQRQFQSTKTSYAGFGLIGGIEKYWKQDFSINTELRYIQLGGSNNGEATETSLMVGVSLSI